MANRYSNLVAEVGETVLEALTADNLQQKIESHQAKAIIHLRQQQFQYAAEALGDMAALIRKEGHPAEEALVRFNQARAYAKLPTQMINTLEACYAALVLAEKAGNRLLRADICLFIAHVEIAHENFFSAHLAIGQAIDHYEALGDQVENLIRCYHLRAGITAFLLMFDLSRRSFMVALELAKMVGDDQKATEIQSHRTAVVQFENGEISADNLNYLLTQINRFGQQQINTARPLNGAVHSLQKDDFSTAQELAETSLRSGLKEKSADGIVKFLLASFVLAEIHDAKNERVAVLNVLLRCKAYSEKYCTNKLSGVFVKQYLNSFHVRWGKTGIKQIVERYHSLATPKGRPQRR